MVDGAGEAPERPRRRRRRPAAAEAVGETDVVVITAPPRTGASALATPLALASAALAAIGHSAPQVAVVSGLGALGAGFFALVQEQRARRIVQIEIDTKRGQMRLVSSSGRSASIAAASIASFDVASRVESTSRSGGELRTTKYSYWLTVRKVDGGAIETFAYEHGAELAARRDVEQCIAALDRSKASAVDAAIDRLAELRTEPRVEVEVHEGTGGGYRVEPGRGGFSIAWPGRQSPTRFLGGLGVIGGMRLAFDFFEGTKGGVGLELARGFMTVMAAVVVCAFVATFWSRIRLVLADGTLTLVHRRFAFWTTTTTWPLADIRAIDLSFERATAVLSVRTSDAPSADDGPAGGVGAVVAALSAQGASTVPLGMLDVTTALQIDVALSEAIAERRGEPSGSI